jgi:hypothetical protein
MGEEETNVGTPGGPAIGPASQQEALFTEPEESAPPPAPKAPAGSRKANRKGAPPGKKGRKK